MCNARYLLLLCLLAGITGLSDAARAAHNESCLGCHGEKAIVNRGGSRLYLDPARFAGTSHAVIGCNSCHAKVAASHPADGIRPSRASCRDCHAPVQQEYGNSLHADKADCVDCHNPHAARNHATVSGRDINEQCAKCHEHGQIVGSHAKWLPQTSLHLDALPCITCHTGSQNYYITMYITIKGNDSPTGDFRLATHEELARIAPGRQFVALLDSNGDGKISLQELRKFNKGAADMRLWGMMMPEVMTHSFQILDNRWDCTFCHSSGPKAMQTSYLAIPEKDGRYNRLTVEKGAILDLLYGTPDFYMMGATRSHTLSVIGLMIIGGGLLMPIGHGTLRFLTRKNRKEH